MTVNTFDVDWDHDWDSIPSFQRPATENALSAKRVLVLVTLKSPRADDLSRRRLVPL